MEYEEFKELIVGKLKDFYGNETEVEAVRISKNNGQGYDGIRTCAKGAPYGIMPVIRLDGFYDAYRNGETDIEGCINRICAELKDNKPSENIVQFMKKMLEWDYVKDNVYPILLSSEENRVLLEDLVSMPMLDLSVAYIVRNDMPGGMYSSVRVTRKMLRHYNVSSAELHRKALANLEKDGYGFQKMESVIHNMLQEWGIESSIEDTPQAVNMYVLTNSKSYGAAGILNKKLVREFAGECNYFILPSSIHETIFIPESDGCDKKSLDGMVREVNETQVDAEERLSDHSYYYDAKADEIRMCA